MGDSFQRMHCLERFQVSEWSEEIKDYFDAIEHFQRVADLPYPLYLKAKCYNEQVSEDTRQRENTGQELEA